MIGCSNCVYADEDFVKVFNIPKVQIENLSMKGMGNRYITNRLFEYINIKGIPDYVYLQYTGLSRIDIPLDKKVTVPDYVYQKKTDKRNWVASGGRNGSWTECNMLKRFFAYMYNIASDSDDCQYDLNLHEIFSAIELCKTLKIPYNWTTYYNYTDRNRDMMWTKQEGLIDKMPEYIDMTNHVGESPLNIAYELGDIPSDGCHYSRAIGEQLLLRNKDKFNL